MSSYNTATTKENFTHFKSNTQETMTMKKTKTERESEKKNPPVSTELASILPQCISSMQKLCPFSPEGETAGEAAAQ